MNRLRVGQIWEAEWADGRLRRARIEEKLFDGSQVLLRFLDNDDVETVEAAALAHVPGSKWQLVAETDDNA